MKDNEPARETPPTSETLYRSIVEEQTELICRRTPDGTITFVNDAYCRYYGFPREELLGRKFLPLIPEEDRHRMDEISSHISLANPVVTYEHRTLSTHPEPRWLQWVKRAIYDEAGRLLEFQHVGRDITNQKDVEAQLRYSTTHDSLTGLFNAAFFEAEIHRLDRGRMFPISIILCDIGGLAGINTRKGQGQADSLLRQTAQVLRCAFRVEDILARIGAEDFGVLLPNTPADVAARSTERMLRCLDAQNKLEGNPEVVYTTGIATAREPSTLEQAYRKAQSELLSGKQKK